MWRPILLILVVFSSVLKAEQKFPYRATVVTDDVEVRCGPGTQFYVTSKLKKSEVVTVHRHDHGGWYMVAPPKGSISWVDASLVRKLNNNRGVIEVAPQEGRPAKAIVRIGSTVSDDHSYYGRELSNGDEITIVGEKTLQTARGPVRMYKIVPPPQEFRWLKGEFLVPQDTTIRQQIANDPYQIPAEHRSTFLEQKQAEAAAARKQAERERNRKQMLYNQLDRIDRQYAAMMQKEPAEWNLAAIEAQYHTLAKGADETISVLIQKRLDVLQRRQQMLSHYQDFVQVSAETAKRDQELVATQLGYSDPARSTTQVMPQGATPANPFAPEPTPQPGEALNSSVSPRLNGAGIIQPLQGLPGGPQYALVNPEGKMLALLETAEGINIRQWIGKQSGIIGNRQYNPQYAADVIRVQRVVPVRLVP